MNQRWAVPCRAWIPAFVAVCLAAATPAAAMPAVNLLTNPHFDIDLTGWSWQGAGHSHQPADGVAAAGSADVLGSDAMPGALAVQCIDVTGQPARATYIYGGWAKPVDFEPSVYGASFIVQVLFHSDPACTYPIVGAGGSGDNTPRPQGTWRRASGGARAPAGTQSIALTFGLEPVADTPALTVRFDDLFLFVAQPPTGLVHLWPLDGSLRDVIGGASTTAFGGPTSSPGVSGQALSFDGVDDYVRAQVDINPATLPAITLGAFAAPSSASVVQTLLSQDNGLFDRSLALDDRGPGGAGWSAFAGSEGVVGGEVAPKVGGWQFVAAAWDQSAANLLLYALGTTTVGATALGTGYPYLDFAQNPGYGEIYQGGIDEVVIFNRVLTVEELDYVAYFGVHVFSDDFESGGYGRWSASAGGS